jgi:prolipoprotein diacylglyceryl transferase
VPFVIATIPSPSFNSIGPFTIYGLMIALGVAAAVVFAQRRWTEAGGNEDDMSSIAIWGVPAGVVGARLYHVLTDFQKFSDEPWWKIFAIREGGLGIPGAMFLGILVGVWIARRRGIELRGALDAVAPALPLAQAIGRWGNWFNQELYGRPTDLPWGLEIDAQHRNSVPAEFRVVDAFPTFHPTFLYEILWNVGLVGVILWVDKKGWLPRGRLIGVYLLGYGIGRGWVEALRIDTVNEIFGLRLNIWMSAVLIIAGLAVLLWPRAKVEEDVLDLDEVEEVEDGLVEDDAGGEEE